MSLQPSCGGGSGPSEGKCWTQRTPLRTGAGPCTSVYWAGGLGTRSLSVISPPVNQLGHRIGTEDQLGGWEVKLGQAEVGAPGVQAYFHVVSDTRLLRCWFHRPQSGGCCNPSPSGASNASGIKCLHVER